ncbi:hypothetical protein ACWGB8_32360 [Kitasatospora sp. NPDC054939]
MSSVNSLVEAVDGLADRFRSMPQNRLLGAVPGHPSRAAAGHALAGRLAAAAQTAEGSAVRAFPDAGAFAVGDQLAVAGHDLAVALAALPAGAAVALVQPLGALPAGAQADPAALLAEALDEVAGTAALCR